MKQPFILTLVSSVACAVTAANKAPENTTPTKSKTPNVVSVSYTHLTLPTICSV